MRKTKKSPHPAVELENLAGGVGETGLKEEEEVGDLGGLVEAAEDVSAADGFNAFGGEGAGHLRFEEAGEDGVDADVGGADFAGEGCAGSA